MLPGQIDLLHLRCYLGCLPVHRLLPYPVNLLILLPRKAPVPFSSQDLFHGSGCKGHPQFSLSRYHHSQLSCFGFLVDF